MAFSWAGSFACAATFSAVGSRRTRAAAFSDDTADEIVASTSRPRGQPSPDEQGVSTSSGETIVRNKGELIPPDPRRAMHMQAGGLGSSRVVPASEMLFCAGRPAAVTAGDEQVAGHDVPAIDRTNITRGEPGD